LGASPVAALLLPSLSTSVGDLCVCACVAHGPIAVAVVVVVVVVVAVVVVIKMQFLRKKDKAASAAVLPAPAVERPNFERLRVGTEMDMLVKKGFVRRHVIFDRDSWRLLFSVPGKPLVHNGARSIWQ
jgi:hypothetical protein